MVRLPSPLIEEIEARTPAGALISLFLDFDGTLVPISTDPFAPRLDGDVAALLQELAGRKMLVTTVISGRAVEDLYTRIRLQGLIYAGNHGMEIFGRQFRFVEPEASGRREALSRLCEEISRELQQFSGTFVENKGLTAAVHYRMARDSERAAIEQIVYGLAARCGNMFRVNPGRKVFDIFPRTGWHKGAAVEWINQHLHAGELLTIYLGDDSTDEDAFCILPE